MKKKITSILFAALMIMLLLPVMAMAEKTVALSLEGEYADDSFPGTVLSVVSDASLDSGEKIVYYLNGEIAGESYEAGAFDYKSVSGKNILTAGIVSDSGEEIAVSEPIELDFARFIELDGKTYSTDFDSGEFNSSEFLEFTYWNKGYIPEILTDEEKQSPVMKVSIVGKDHNGWEMRFPGSDIKGSYKGGWAVFEFDIKFANFYGGSNRLFFVKTAGGGEVIGATLTEGAGKLSVGDNLEKDRWYNMRSVINLDEKTADFYLDGVMLQADRVLPSNFSDIRYYNLPRFMLAANDTSDSTYYIDNIRLSNYASTYDVEVYTDAGGERTEGLDGFPLSGGSAVIKFSEKMSGISKDDIVLTVEGEEADFDFVFDSENNEAVIIPIRSFNGREKCKISFDGIETSQGLGAACETFVEFTADAPIYGIASVEYDSPVAGADCEITVKVNNATDTPKNGIVLTGIYDSNGLVGVNAASVSVDSIDDNSVSLTVKVPASYDADTHYVCTYLMTSDTYFAVDMLK